MKLEPATVEIKVVRALENYLEEKLILFREGASYWIYVLAGLLLYC